MLQCVQIVGRVPEARAEDVYRLLADFERYPELSQTVREVRIEKADDGSALSHWTVNFRNGTLRWTELDRSDPVNMVLGFVQIEGDFEMLVGEWRITPADGGCSVEFNGRFDLGIPSLEHIVDPVARRLLVETIEKIVNEVTGREVEYTVATAAGDNPLELEVTAPPSPG
jgi:ribosome-associated toxin RatA of RatAB toxin-antitoxin module